MKSTIKVISVLLILALICFYGISVLADTTDSTTITTTDQTTTDTTADQTTTDSNVTDQPAIDTTPTVTEKDNQLADSISNKFNTIVTGQNVRDLRVSGMGYGSITITYAMAAVTGKSVSDITTMRQQGLGWGEIANQSGVKVSDLLGKSSRVLKSTKLNQEAKEVKNQAKQEAGKNNNSGDTSKSNNGSNKTSSNSSSHSSGNSSGSNGSKGGGKH